MTSGTETLVEDAIAQAAAVAGLQIDPTFESADLAGVPGPFVTMNVPDADGGVAICIALRDDMSTDGSLLEQLAAAVVAAEGSERPAEAAGPVGTGADLDLRFTTPVTTVALTDGEEIQALIVIRTDRRTTTAGTQEAASAMSGGGSKTAVSPSGTPVGSLDKLGNVALDVSVELGRTFVTLAEVMDYHVGSVIELDRAAGSPVDIRVNGMLLAQGEVVLIDDEYAVRITAIVDPQAGA